MPNTQGPPCAKPIMPDRNARQPNLDREEYRVTKFHAVVPLIAMLTSSARAADSTRDVSLAVPEFATLQPKLEALYMDLHQHPELAFHEVPTADNLATRLQALGYEVTTGARTTRIVPCFLP